MFNLTKKFLPTCLIFKLFNLMLRHLKNQNQTKCMFTLQKFAYFLLTHGCQCLGVMHQPIILQNVCQKLHENDKI